MEGQGGNDIIHGTCFGKTKWQVPTAFTVVTCCFLFFLFTSCWYFLKHMIFRPHFLSLYRKCKIVGDRYPGMFLDFWFRGENYLVGFWLFLFGLRDCNKLVAVISVIHQDESKERKFLTLILLLTFHWQTQFMFHPIRGGELVIQIKFHK